MAKRNAKEPSSDLSAVTDLSTTVLRQYGEVTRLESEMSSILPLLGSLVGLSDGIRYQQALSSLREAKDHLAMMSNCVQIQLRQLHAVLEAQNHAATEKTDG